MSEAAAYLELPGVSMDIDILEWWAALLHMKRSLFPISVPWLCSTLGCPATSASAERLFSIAGRVYDDLRQAIACCYTGGTHVGQDQ